ncbi:MAG: TRAM domain-containing protein, partial [Anaerolineae bacterium]
IGLVIGLIIAALLALPLSLLPSPINQILPFVSAVIFGYLGVVAMTARQQEVFSFVRGSRGTGKALPAAEPQERLAPPVLLDTSVIIDGRIADISQTGFLRGELLVPNFVLNELQHIADSSDTLRRNRGRRGLDILRRLQEESVSPVRITDTDVEGVHEVDDKLVLLAKQLRCAIVTNDYNLNRVAELQGVPVLNINELANAVKTVYLPGESFRVSIIQEGKETDQGVGYLDDGTMVVIENGRPHIGSTIDVNVTKVLQTAAGRMIFARPERS